MSIYDAIEDELLYMQNDPYGFEPGRIAGLLKERFPALQDTAKDARKLLKRIMEFFNPIEGFSTDGPAPQEKAVAEIERFAKQAWSNGYDSGVENERNRLAPPTPVKDARELAELIAGIAYQANMRTPEGYEQMTQDIAARLTPQPAAKDAREQTGDLIGDIIQDVWDAETNPELARKWIAARLARAPSPSGYEWRALLYEADRLMGVAFEGIEPFEKEKFRAWKNKARMLLFSPMGEAYIGNIQNKLESIEYSQDTELCQCGNKATSLLSKSRR